MADSGINMTRLSLYLQPDAEPTLSQEEMSAVLDLASRPDKYGYLPSQDGWTPTYDLASAVAEGWQVKAAKVAGNYLFQDSSLVLHREQILANCLAMAAEWKKKSSFELVDVVNPDIKIYEGQP